MILKLDGSNLPFSPDDFSVGLDIGICGRSIRIYDCDDYTRQYFEVSIIQKTLLIIYFRIKVEFKPKPKDVPKTLSLFHKNQELQPKILSFQNIWKRNWEEEKSHHKNNSQILTEKYLHFLWYLKIFNLFGTISLQMIPYKSEKCIFQMTEEIPFQFI